MKKHKSKLTIFYVKINADYTSIFFHHKKVMEIENGLHKKSANLCEWFVDDKLSVHFGEDKTKCILFTKEENLPVVNTLIPCLLSGR